MGNSLRYRTFALSATLVCSTGAVLAQTNAPRAPEGGASRGTITAPAPTVPASASAITVAGVAFEAEVNLGGKVLKLNGAGLRTRAFFKIYAAALYLPARAKTPAEVLSSPGPKRLHVTMLRELDSAGFGKTTSQVMNDNLPRDKMGKCVPGLVKLGEVFSKKKKMGVGEYYVVDQLPGKGTVISINGQKTAEVAETEFFDCLMYNYFGDKPADSDLKANLLGN